MRASTTSPSLLIVANWDWVIYNFRLSLAQSAREAGYDVTFVCPSGEYVDRLQSKDFRWIEWPLERKSLNPITEVSSILALARIYEHEQPALIHHDTIKPNVYGALATWLNGVKGVWEHPPRLINSFMGIGFMFSDRFLARVLRPFVLPIMRFGMRRDYVYTTFSNQRDLDTFVERGIIDPSGAKVMVSEFVNTERFTPSQGRTEDEKSFRVLMAARLLWDKGVEEFVEAAQILEDRGVTVEFLLAGEPDMEAQGYVSTEKLEKWNQTGPIRWLGHRSDMPSLLRKVDVAVLPTHYNEGLPRFLVEAASSGLPLVASDLPACRRIVEDGVNGWVIPKESSADLANAIEDLAKNSDKRREKGNTSRRKVLSEFDQQRIIQEWLDLYRALLEEGSRAKRDERGTWGENSNMH